jgi:hypothetical protein
VDLGAAVSYITKELKSHVSDTCFLYEWDKSIYTPKSRDDVDSLAAAG